MKPPASLVERRWSSGESVQQKKKFEMSKIHQQPHHHNSDPMMTSSSSVPTESSPISKKFRLFKRKSMLAHRDISLKRGLSTGRSRRSHSLDESSNAPDIDIEDLKQLRLRVTIEQAKYLTQVK
jgi:hypothetical protein